MNWLILSNDGQNAEEIKELINSTFVNSTIHEAALQSKDFFHVYDKLNLITHCVIFSNSASHSADVNFILGFLTGKKMTVYSVDKMGIETAVKHGFVEYFQDDVSLYDFLKNNSKKIIKDNLVREAKHYLIERGIPLTSDNFAEAIEKGDKELCRYFYVAGLDVNVRDSLGTPMLNIAARTDNLEMVIWLIERGADINATSEDRGYTAVMDAVWRGDKKITSYLIEKKADLNTVNKEGQTNIVLAVGADRTEICKMLVENGADPDVPDSMGMSAYGYAQLFKKDEIAAILEKYHKED